MASRLMFALWLIALVVISALSLAPREFLDENPGLFDSISDKAQHLVAYCGLTALAMGAFRSTPAAISIGAAMFPHGVIVEVLQSVMHLRRNFELYDIAFDAAGVICGMGAGFLIRGYLDRRAGTQPLRERS